MPEDFKVPSNEITGRTQRLQKKMRVNNMDGLLIVQRVDLFYFSGTAQNGALYIPMDGDPVLFVLKYMPRAIVESPLQNIIEIKSMKEIPGLMVDHFGLLPEKLGLEFDVLPVKDFHFYQSFMGVRDYMDGSRLIMETRMIKSDWEIDQMDKSAELGQKTFEYMCSAIRSGITEMEFSGMCETFARKMGHGAGLRIRNFQTEGYAWHILSGKNGGIVGLLDAPASGMGTSPAFPCGAGSKRFCEHEPIMIDFGTVLNGYHIDETRMFAIGSMPDKAMKACDASIAIHDMVLENAKPGVTLGELFQLAVLKADALGYAEQFLGPTGYKVTFVGHGIGLELVEYPFIAKNRDMPLEPGMTFALEPKMVFEDEFAAGIESVFQVTETGHRLISKVPVKVFIC
ncbi:MAG: aminopeptidase P family protein [Deltaproteobacteria bacterium]|nr:aminopeptidase P family protein [Deltaproteobacteria bacterium]